MKKIVLLIILSILTISCSNKKNGNMIVKGQLKGLKKGTLYLKKVKDTTLVTVDSTNIFGDKSFSLSDKIESPQIYYLTVDKNNVNQLAFFGEKGTISINGNIKELWKANVSGSKNHDALVEFEKYNKKMNEQQLELTVEELNAKVKKDLTKSESIAKKRTNIIRKQYLYTTNFALSKKNMEVAPYLAINVIPNANIYLLDTINNSLTENIKQSYYGKKLNKYIQKIKETK